MSIDLLSFTITSVSLAIVQMGIFFSLPEKMRYIMAGVPILGVILNWAFSSIILLFTGAGTFVGISNMVGSLLFAGQILAYKKVKKIDTVYYGFDKKRKGIKKYIPTLIVKYEENKSVGRLYD